jgi:hypothetical protein
MIANFRLSFFGIFFKGFLNIAAVHSLNQSGNESKVLIIRDV